MSRITIACIAALALGTTLGMPGAVSAQGGGWEPPPPAENTPAEGETPAAEATPTAEATPAEEPEAAPAEAEQPQSAWAQVESERPPSLGGRPEAPAPVVPETPEVPEPAEPTTGGTDHSQVSYGISYFGLNDIRLVPTGATIGNGADAATIPSATIQMPRIGARLWFGSIGLDLGVGLGIGQSKSFDTCPRENVGTDEAPAFACGTEQRLGGLDGMFAFGVHAGLPIVVNEGQHYALLVIPEVDFSYGTGSLFHPENPDGDVGFTAWQIDAGLRFGAEVQFGGIGLPNLGLQFTVGLGFRYHQATAEDTQLADVPTLVSAKSSELSIRTVANDLLDGLVRLNYYF